MYTKLQYQALTNWSDTVTTVNMYGSYLQLVKNIDFKQAHLLE